MMSVRGRRERNKAREEGNLRFKHMEDLFVANMSPVGGGRPGGDVGLEAVGGMGFDWMIGGGGWARG